MQRVALRSAEDREDGIRDVEEGEEESAKLLIPFVPASRRGWAEIKDGVNSRGRRIPGRRRGVDALVDDAIPVPMLLRIQQKSAWI